MKIRSNVKAGMDVELKSVVSNVFFSSDVANPDTYTKFYSDLQMYNVGPGAPDPQTFMSNFTSAEICSKENKWARRNTTRWRNEEYDRLWKAAESEMDPVKRAALFIRMNDMLTQHVVVIPIVWRNSVAGVSNRLKGMSEVEVNYREMILEGVLALQAGDNPSMLAERLDTFLEPSERGGGKKDAAGDADEPALREAVLRARREEPREPLLRGDELGLAPGPEVGRVLEIVEEERAAGSISRIARLRK